MSEKRTPSISLRIATASGKKVKLELYDAALWSGKNGLPMKSQLKGKYRIRVDRKWFIMDPNGGRYQFATLWEFRDKFFNSLKRMLND